MAVFDVVPHLATLVAGALASAPGFYSMVLNGDMNLLDLL